MSHLSFPRNEKNKNKNKKLNNVSPTAGQQIDKYLINISFFPFSLNSDPGHFPQNFFCSVFGCHIELSIYDEIDPRTRSQSKKMTNTSGSKWVQLMNDSQLLGTVPKRIHMPQVVKERSISIQGTAINQKEIKAFKNSKAGNIFLSNWG